MMRRTLGIGGHPDGLKRFLGALHCFLGVLQIVKWPEGDIFQYGRHKELIGRIFEKQSYQPAHLGQVSLVNLQAEHFERPPGLEHPIEAFNQGGLPRAIGANQGQRLAFLKVKSNPSQGVISCRISISQVLNSKG